MKKPYEIDVPVLLIFFIRPNQFAKVFEQVRKAKPSKLLLYQDGPRSNRPEDIALIRECRDIVENIDWDCQVYKLYQDTNFGVDPSMYLAQKWAFNIVEECIIIEDDCVPNQSFFLYCKELLEKYRYDNRINMITGMNHTGTSEHRDDSYLFSYTGAIWGWASWRRVIDTWDDTYSFLEDEKLIFQLKEAYKGKLDMNSYLNKWRAHKKTGVVHFESVLRSSALINSRLDIVPTKNLISNIGVTENASHSVSELKMLAKGIRRVFNMKTYDLVFPLRHPDYVIDDYIFRKKKNRIMGFGYPLVKLFRRVESTILRIRYGGTKTMFTSIKDRIVR